jgi:hypothetical protein
LDLETRKLLNGQLEVLSLVYYNGENYKIFKINDFNNQDDLMHNVLLSLLKPEFYGYTIYIHNLSNFDGIFLFRSITQLKEKGADIQFIYKNNKMILINIELRDNDIKTKISFRDSYLLLPVSLTNLAKSFNLPGKIKYDIKLNDNLDVNNELDMSTLVEYNKQDCKVLFDVINSFGTIIKDYFKIDIHKSYTPTLSSLAFKIFKVNFLKENQIAKTSAEMYDRISSGYRGGHVDIYRPYGEDLFNYDVNSLYPSVMAKYPYPIGNPTYFVGSRDLDSIFGLVHVRVKSPGDLDVPMLLIKHDGKTIAPLGSWSGWYVSEELKNARS